MASSDSQRQWGTGKLLAWPDGIGEYLQNWIWVLRSPAFLVTDPEGGVLSAGGDLRRYGLVDLRKGESASQKAYFLAGLLPLDKSSSALSRVETTAGVFADIHLFHIREGDCVLLLDASEEVAERAQIEVALRQTEEQLRQGDKMQALGRLAGGVAHDFNNLLTIILGYSHLLMEAQLGDRYRAAAREIRQAADRAAQMTQHLLSFSRNQARHVEVLDLNALISGLHHLLRRLIGEDIALNTNLDSSLAFVEADCGQIEQVLMNLAANARDAMPRGGRIEISTANVEVDSVYLRAHSTKHLRPGPHVKLSVHDTGCGMDAKTMARAFEPFFTSKEAGRGTGLGLAIVYGIVSQSGGEIFLTSQVGEGTLAEILLPVVSRAPLAAKVVDQCLPRGIETILLVEDEDCVRQLVREILTELGYEVLEFAEPNAALALCRRRSGKVDLLMTDFILPQMNGRELAERIVATHPETRVLYMSGYAKESFSNRGLDLRGSVFLSKPFTPATLAGRVREALDRPNSIIDGAA
jgi:signal transduction histidine kinase/ActR/RegA family two-component response regulator